MADRAELAAQKREVTGKQVKRLRNQGLVPAVLYGHKEESLPLQLDRDSLEKTFKRVGTSSALNLKVGTGRPSMVLVKQVQYHPTRGSLIHVDFLRVAAREKIKTRVPLRFVGEPPVAKTHQVAIMRPVDEIVVECYPADIPHAVDVDLTILVDTTSTVRVSDLNPGPGVSFVSKADEVVASVSEAPKEAVLPEPEEEAVEAAVAEAEAESTTEAEAESEQE